MDQGKKKLWKNERMYEHFVKEMPETKNEKETCNWLTKADQKVEMEAILYAAQEQTIRINYLKHRIEKNETIS